MGSSTFRDCDFYLDESQVLNVCNFRCMCQRFKTMLCYFYFKT
ncbi:hypothetical protein HanIR_Chr08g0350141 [Helianthus annuus]|nr:hypothetical protein HanIR_Chr08g0350141 [Helianthus annuus]